jgi:hypothetical protein
MPTRREPLLAAHRGESRDVPEIALAAFRLGWVRGVRVVALDVRLTAAGADAIASNRVAWLGERLGAANGYIDGRGAAAPSTGGTPCNWGS